VAIVEHERKKREQAHFEAVADTDLYWAERVPAAPRRREIRAGLVLTAAGLGDGAGRHVLDLGCGTGQYTWPYARRTRATVVGLDVTAGLLCRARNEAPANVRLAAGDVVALPFSDATFDAAVGNAVLHHLPLEAALRELLRVLKPGGRIAFAEPNLLNPQVLVERKVPWVRRWLENSPDEIAFVRWRLRRVLERLGVADVSIRPFDFLYPLTPASLIPVVEAVGRALEATPLVREIAGSLLVCGRKA
jgi:SAM-dependent methyltransferase